MGEPPSSRLAAQLLPNQTCDNQKFLVNAALEPMVFATARSDFGLQNHRYFTPRLWQGKVRRGWAKRDFPSFTGTGLVSERDWRRISYTWGRQVASVLQEASKQGRLLFLSGYNKLLRSNRRIRGLIHIDGDERQEEWISVGVYALTYVNVYVDMRCRSLCL